MSLSEPPAGQRLALVVATNEYDDASLRRLRAPARDAEALAEVLADSQIGGFTVTEILDRPAQEIREAVEDFLSDRAVGDLVLVYLSCHGLRDDWGKLFFAGTETKKDRLESTGVDSSWLLSQMERARPRKQVLVLDCCFSGAVIGTKASSDIPISLLSVEGRGRVVLTASRAYEYSFEGEHLPGASVSGSVFTTALVEGLRTGAADLNDDGLIDADEAYSYVYEQVRASGASQTPQRSMFKTEGRIVIAYNPAAPRAQAPDSVEASGEARVVAMPDAAPASVETAAPRTAADDLATLRIVRDTENDMASLREAARERSVAQVADLAAALRVVDRQDDATHLLALAATERPVADVLGLVAVMRDSGYLSDIHAVLTAAATSRPPADLAELAGAMRAQAFDSEASHLLSWVGNTRSPSDTCDIVAELRRVSGEDANAVLRDFAAARPTADVASLVATLRQAGRDSDAAPVLGRFAERPMSDAAALVAALREAGHDSDAEHVLGWVEDLPLSQVRQLAAALRADGRHADADVALRWIGWKGDAEAAAELIARLRESGQDTDADTVRRAAEPRSAPSLARLLLDLYDKGHNGDVAALLSKAAERPASDVVYLMRCVNAANSYYLARSSTIEMLMSFVATRPMPDLLQVLKLLQPEQTRHLLPLAGLRSGTEVTRLVKALRDWGREQEVSRVLRSSTECSPSEVVELVSALRAADLDEDADAVLHRNGAHRPAAEVIQLAQALRRGPERNVVRLLEATPPNAWVGRHSLAEELSFGGHLDEQVREIERRQIDRSRRMSGWDTRHRLYRMVSRFVAYTPAAFLAGAVGATLDTHRDFAFRDWGTFAVITMLVVGCVLLLRIGLWTVGPRAALLVPDGAGTLLAHVLVIAAGFLAAEYVHLVARIGSVIGEWLALRF